MPELPEVETIRLGLQKYLVGKKIIDIQIKVPKLFFGNKKDVIGAKITGLKRIGKGLIIELDNDFVLAVHLKMTGQLVYSDSKTKNLTLSPKVGGTTLPSKYSHIIFKLKAQSSKRKTTTQSSKLRNEPQEAFLYYNDLRRFGWIKVVKKDELMQIPFFKDMGPEPEVTSKIKNQKSKTRTKKSDRRTLTLDKFRDIVSSAKTAVKSLLMDQKKIGGIGNIYANDALFDSKIAPSRKAKDLTKDEIERLYDSLIKVLKKGLDCGGSSDENFVNVLGQEGNYQKHTLVYGKEGEKCRVCGSKIKKIQLRGRGTYFCPNCQR